MLLRGYRQWLSVFCITSTSFGERNICNTKTNTYLCLPKHTILLKKNTMICFVFKKSWELSPCNSRTVTTRIQEPLWLRTGETKITPPFYKTLFNLTSCTGSYLAKKCKEFLKSYILILTRNISNLSLFLSLQYKEKKKHTLLKIKYDIVFLPKEGTRPILFFFF